MSPRPRLHPSRPWTVLQLPLRPRSGSNAASAGAHVRMDEPVRRLVLALVGAVALTAERADELADSLAQRGGMNKDEVRSWIDEATTRWRGDAVRVGERAGATLNGAFRELGLVTREEWDELELRVAQLEHRLRLVESRPRAVPPPGS
jgi:polyhydroxyalkanoate synthesis regulator phasin